MSEFRIERDQAGQYVWRLVGDDGLKLADSGAGFLTEDAARDAVEAVRRAAPAAGVVETVASSNGDEAIDEAIDESFPASDPPSAWAGSGS